MSEALCFILGHVPVTDNICTACIGGEPHMVEMPDGTFAEWTPPAAGCDFTPPGDAPPEI